MKEIDAGGNLTLKNGWTIDRDFGHLAYGYVVTSHASQGESVDRVFIGQSAASWPASSRVQFYVSVSRGRKSATIYTDDKAELLDAVSDSEDRPTATEFMSDAQRRERGRANQRASAAAGRAAANERETAASRDPRREREFVHE